MAFHQNSTYDICELYYKSCKKKIYIPSIMFYFQSKTKCEYNFFKSSWHYLLYKTLCAFCFPQWQKSFFYVHFDKDVKI
jgi:hypothetical protein